MKFFKAETYKDKRGVIVNATPNNPVIRNVMYITGKKGSVRGDHWHKKDKHYCLVIEGIIEYTERKIKSNIYERIVLKPGDIVLSDKNTFHRFKFLTDGVFIAMATLPRTHKDYEKDTVRKEFNE